MIRAAWICPVIAGSYEIAIEVRRAVGLCCGPFSNYSPFISIPVCVCVIADELAMLPVFHANKVVVEDLVFMMVDDDWRPYVSY
jgi:hypothetical protein